MRASLCSRPSEVLCLGRDASQSILILLGRKAYSRLRALEEVIGGKGERDHFPAFNPTDSQNSAAYWVNLSLPALRSRSVPRSQETGEWVRGRLEGALPGTKRKQAGVGNFREVLPNLKSICPLSLPPAAPPASPSQPHSLSSTFLPFYPTTLPLLLSYSPVRSSFTLFLRDFSFSSFGNGILNELNRRFIASAGQLSSLQIKISWWNTLGRSHT